MTKCPKCGTALNASGRCAKCEAEARIAIKASPSSPAQIPTKATSFSFEEDQHIRGSGELWAGKLKSLVVRGALLSAIGLAGIVAAIAAPSIENTRNIFRDTRPVFLVTLIVFAIGFLILGITSFWTALKGPDRRLVRSPWLFRSITGWVLLVLLALSCMGLPTLALMVCY
jgi:uncharacterized membrane protein YidH (DUF202 family)